LFNGSSAAGTSKLQNNTADLIDEHEMTICAWVQSSGVGEDSGGTLVSLDEAQSGVLIQHYSSLSKLVFGAKFASVNGAWTFPIVEDTWCAVAVSYDTDTPNDLTARVNFADVTVTQLSTPSGAAPNLNTGYCVGNNSGQNYTWQGRIAHVQIFNRILFADEMDACLWVPGSITSGLRLWLPMTKASDTTDKSGNGFDGTPTDLNSGSNGPILSTQSALARGITVVPPLDVSIVNDAPVWTYMTVTQHLIPRYACGVGQPNNWSTTRSIAPAGQLIGAGPMSVIRGNGSTSSQTVKAVVITEDYDNAANLALYGSGEYNQSGYKPAVLRPVVRDLTIAGHDETGTNYVSAGVVGNDPINRIPWNRIQRCMAGCSCRAPALLSTT
jgi:hypothetical protein